MQAQHQSSSKSKAITPTGHLMATAMIGAAVIGYVVQKTSEARTRLESLSTLARTQGELTDSDAAVVARLLSSVKAVEGNHFE